MLDTLIYNWLLGGADCEVGLRLFMDFCNPKLAIVRIVSKSPTKHQQVIKLALFRNAAIPYDFKINKPSANVEATTNKKQLPIIRTQWPFLAENDCPPELKLLISDKITAYRNCVENYDQMVSATNTEERLKSVHSLVSNFIENHEIFRELKHYRDHKKVLGEHPMFAQYQRVKDLRTLKTLDLVKKKENLEHKIWRNKSEIKKGNKPELTSSRKAKIKQYEMELAEVLRLLD